MRSLCRHASWYHGKHAAALLVFKRRAAHSQRYRRKTTNINLIQVHVSSWHFLHLLSMYLHSDVRWVLSSRASMEMDASTKRASNPRTMDGCIRDACAGRCGIIRVQATTLACTCACLVCTFANERLWHLKPTSVDKQTTCLHNKLRAQFFFALAAQIYQVQSRTSKNS